MILNECIIWGGGKSISEGISLGLKEKLQNKFVIVCNYGFRHFDGTFLCFHDRDFYKPKPEAKNPDIYEELKSLSLLIGMNLNGIEEFKLKNTILLKHSDNYHREKCIENGFYSANLTGILALTLASYLMNYNGTIFLLGFDWNRRNPNEINKEKYSGKTNLKIHYYDDIKHRGLGYVGFYECHNPNNYFKYFDKEKDLKIYNVSLNSNIQNFEKISYTTMFSKLNNVVYDQNDLRNYIKEKICIK